MKSKEEGQQDLEESGKESLMNQLRTSVDCVGFWMHKENREVVLYNENSIYGGIQMWLAMEEDRKLILEESEHSIKK